MKKVLAIFSLLAVLVILTSCTFKKAELGTEDNPVKLFFVPSVEAKTLQDNSAVIKKLLEKFTPYKYQVRIPESYIAVVEAFGASRVDVAALNTFGYVLANDKYGAEALLTVIRHGKPTYRSAIYARASDKLEKLEDLKGKTIAYVDPASISGYMLPLKEIKEKNIETGRTVYAMTHDAVISMLYQGRVDAGAAFYSPPAEGQIQDARHLVKTQYPDVENKIKILHLTAEIPNEPVVFRKDLSPEMKKNISEALIKIVETPEGKEALSKMFSITELRRAKDSDYDAVRAMLTSLGVNATELIQKK